MQGLSASVGENGKNAIHDIALVQAILVLTKRPAILAPKTPQYLQSYDGDCGRLTKQAIRDYQSDYVFVSADGQSSQNVPNATPGLISPGDATWKKLELAPQQEFQDLRILFKSKTVYVAATGSDLAASKMAVTSATFENGFRLKVLRLIDQIFNAYGIVVSVCAQGDRRTFQTQYELLTSGRGVTKAGPGESNHNFGQAVDLGFQDLRWLKCDGTDVTREDSWMHKMDSYKPFMDQSRKFWDMLRIEGTSGSIGLFRGPLADKPHLQAWSDHGIDMAGRLADLLTRSGKTRWTGMAQRYKNDLGFGGAYFDVGTAAQIWAGSATVSNLNIAQASKRKPNEVKPDEVSKMQTRLFQDFEAADANWQSWQPK
jgi:hypothetical protein